MIKGDAKAISKYLKGRDRRPYNKTIKLTHQKEGLLPTFGKDFMSKGKKVQTVGKLVIPVNPNLFRLVILSRTLYFSWSEAIKSSEMFFYHMHKIPAYVGL